MKLYCIYRCFNTQNYIYPFQNFSLGFILKIFLKFRKFQPRYSYKIYSYIKNRVYNKFCDRSPKLLEHCYAEQLALVIMNATMNDPLERDPGPRGFS